MRFLIGVTTCHKFVERANVQRRTWVPDAKAAGIDVRFFVGDGVEAPNVLDTIYLPVLDDYQHLPLKVQAMFAWGVEQGYDFTLKTDDDTLVRPQNLLKELGDYIGHSNRLYCSGFGYTLSRRAAEIVSRAKWDGDPVEDRWVGGVLAAEGITPQDSPNRLIFRPQCGYRCRTHWRGSAIGWRECSDCALVKQTASVICPYKDPEYIEQLYRL
jgi:hypothetical protein